MLIHVVQLLPQKSLHRSLLQYALLRFLLSTVGPAVFSSPTLTETSSELANKNLTSGLPIATSKKTVSLLDYTAYLSSNGSAQSSESIAKSGSGENKNYATSVTSPSTLVIIVCVIFSGIMALSTRYMYRKCVQHIKLSLIRRPSRLRNDNMILHATNQRSSDLPDDGGRQSEDRNLDADFHESILSGTQLTEPPLPPRRPQTTSRDGHHILHGLLSGVESAQQNVHLEMFGRSGAPDRDIINRASGLMHVYYSADDNHGFSGFQDSENMPYMTMNESNELIHENEVVERTFVGQQY